MGDNERRPRREGFILDVPVCQNIVANRVQTGASGVDPV
jgi:hypothetical protein